MHITMKIRIAIDCTRIANKAFYPLASVHILVGGALMILTAYNFARHTRTSAFL